MAHRDEQVRLEFSVAIGGAADMDGRAAQSEPGANDPNRTPAASKSCSAASPDLLFTNPLSLPWFGAADAIWSTEAPRVHHAPPHPTAVHFGHSSG